VKQFKQIISHSGLLFGGLLASMWLGLLIADGALILIVRLSFSVSPFVNRMCRIVGYIAVLSVCMAICSSKIVFKHKAFRLRQTIASAVLMCIYQMAIAPLFKFAMYATGAAWYLGEVFCGGANTPIGQVGYAPSGCYILGMLICDIFYLVAICTGGYIGYLKRKKFVKDLTENRA